MFIVTLHYPIRFGIKFHTGKNFLSLAKTFSLWQNFPTVYVDQPLWKSAYGRAVLQVDQWGSATPLVYLPRQPSWH